MLEIQGYEHPSKPLSPQELQQAHYKDTVDKQPGGQQFEVRRRQAQADIRRLLGSVEYYLRKRDAQEPLKVVHVCAGNGAVTQALVDVLSEKYPEFSIVSVDNDPDAEAGHELITDPRQMFVLAEVIDHLRNSGDTYDLIVGLLAPGAVITAVADVLSEKKDELPVWTTAVFTTSSPLWKAERQYQQFDDVTPMVQWQKNNKQNPIKLNYEFTNGYMDSDGPTSDDGYGFDTDVNIMRPQSL